MNHTSGSKKLPPGLDDRHALIMQGLADGLPQTAVAQKLGCHQSTISRLLCRILPLTKSGSVHEAIKHWERRGWVR